MALALAFCLQEFLDEHEWVFASAFCAFVGAVFTAGMLIIRGLMPWQRNLFMIVAGTFGGGCCVGALLGVVSAIEGFLGGFAVLGIGFLLSAAGLLRGIIDLVGMRPVECDRDRLLF